MIKKCLQPKTKLNTDYTNNVFANYSSNQIASNQQHIILKNFFLSHCKIGALVAHNNFINSILSGPVYSHISLSAINCYIDGCISMMTFYMTLINTELEFGNTGQQKENNTTS